MRRIAMSSTMSRVEPVIIQGGMGVAVSGWPLARAVSRAGQLGVVSGTALDVVLARRLQLGDIGGHVRRALAEFPFREMTQRILDRYFVNGGCGADQRFLPTHALSLEPTQEEQELVVAANFVEVFLAKEGHDGLVGINYLEKIQTPTLASLFGAMLARVDYVLMGAGIPRAIPGVLDKLANGQAVELPLNVLGAKADDHFDARFDPLRFGGGSIPWMERPKFLAIIASATLASMLAQGQRSRRRLRHRRTDGRRPQCAATRPDPIERSRRTDLRRPRRGRPGSDPRPLGLPFWLAGSFGSPQRIAEALDVGAAGVQVGTAFAFCEESGLNADIKFRVIEACRRGELDVFTDPVASPTGFPFKVLRLSGTMSELAQYETRQRICDLGFLRQAFRKPDGTVGWRCPGEPVATYVRKGGDAEDTCGRKCLCNGLLANVDLGQRRPRGESELPLVTCGDDVQSILQFLKSPEAASYSAADVVAHLLSGIAAPAMAS